MTEQIIALTGTGHNPTYADQAISQLRQEYRGLQRLFQAQPAPIQRILEAQAEVIADAILQGARRVRFSLPDQVQPARSTRLVSVPAEQRQQTAGGALGGTDLRNPLRQCLLGLEQSEHPGVAASAVLLRYSVAVYLVHSILPAGHTVTYNTAESDTIPSIPQPRLASEKPAISATAEAEIDDQPDLELQVPYVEAARRFYLPQWVAIDDQGRLLVNSLNEADAFVASLQRYLFILHTAVGLAPYMVADEIYQQKRYGALGQLVNQGRALARYQVQQIVHTIQRRAADQDLNRGLRISLTYFDDQKLSVEGYEFDVIPAGRVPFIPAFVVRAAHEQQVKVAQDTRLSPATRRHLLTLLYLLGSAFYAPDANR